MPKTTNEAKLTEGAHLMFVPNCNSNKFYVVTLHIKLYFVNVHKGNSNFQRLSDKP